MSLVSSIPSGMEMAYTEQQISVMREAAILQILATYFTIFAVIALVYATLMVVATWRIFKKAGTGGWKALIPVYADYTFYKIAWKKRYFYIAFGLTIISSCLSNLAAPFSDHTLVLILASFLLLLPALIIDIISIVKLAKIFGKGGWFAAGLIFFPIIFLPILGFGKAKYRRRKRRRRKKSLPPPEAA